MFRNRGSDLSGFIRGAARIPFFGRRGFIIIKYDKNFILIQTIFTLIIILLAFTVYLITYKPAYMDPMADLKKTFLIFQFSAIMISVVLAGLSTIFTKSSKERLIKNLLIVAVLSIFMIFLSVMYKLNIDKKYNNRENFSRYYNQYESKKNTRSQNKISIGTLSVKIASNEEDYIQKSFSAYNNFSIKVGLYWIVHAIIVILLFYLIHRLIYRERKLQRLQKDDIVVYDEEQNIKI